VATFVALVAGAHLVIAAPSEATVPVAMYVAGLIALFGVSALYHKPMWPLSVRGHLKRLDHATIFLFIAATYTPICLLALGSEGGQGLLTIAWIGAGIGALKSIVWPGAPRMVTAALYVSLGWLAVLG